ncbi:MAG TPA: hypothetical protein VMF89_15840 [Polyangiales bacterium]|nr:hypothetical protein [Polyangiales bacterium]
MGERAQTGRRRLLVAAVGVATVSLLGEQGCSSPRYETYSSGNLVPPPPQQVDAGVVSEGDAGRVEARGSAREQDYDAGR